MTDTRMPAAPSSTRRAAVVSSIVALVLGLLEAGLGAYCWYVTSIDPSDDPLVAIGYVVAIAIGVPGAVGLLLAGLGWLFADRVAGLVLAIVAVVVAGVPVLLFVPSFLVGS